MNVYCTVCLWLLYSSLHLAETCFEVYIVDCVVALTLFVFDGLITLHYVICAILSLLISILFFLSFFFTYW